MEAKKYAMHMMWSDVVPYEVIKTVSDKTLVIRKLDAKLVSVDKDDLQNSQVYEFSSNEDNEVLRIRLSKYGYWKHKHSKFRLADKPYKFYDYNF